MRRVTTSGTGVFFDGHTSRRQDVHVGIEAAGLALIRPDGVRLDVWPYADLREISGPDGLLRLAREGGAPLARLEIRDAAVASAIRQAAPRLGAARRDEHGATRKVVLWSLAAVVSLGLFALYGVPALADRVTPLLPWSVDQRMGRAGDGQIRAMFPTEPGGFACGEGSQERPGREALDRLAKTLSDAAALPVPIEIVAVRSDFVNALALPGGTIYLFNGLLERVRSGDELAGVLAHEIGHVANRDGTRRALQAGGASLLLSFVIGDFVGAAATVAIVRVLSDASYSRAAETRADAYSVALMKALGADPRAVGAFLERVTEDADEAPADDGEAGGQMDDTPKDDQPRSRDVVSEWISSHPETADRRRAIEALAGSAATSPLVDAADFLAIKRICGPGT